MTSQPILFQDSEVYNNMRSARYSARSFLQSFTSLNRVRSCGHHSHTNRVDFYRGVNAQGFFRSSSRNLISCGSLWACPFCSFSSSAVRSAQISNILSGWKILGYSTSFATLTVSHNKNTRLDTLWDSLLISYKNFQQGKGYQNLKTKYNIVGSVRAVEATYGKNGWHLHIHLVFMHTTKINISNLSDSVYSRWETVTRANGLQTSKSGFDIRRSFSDSGLSSYLNKNNYDLGKELTNTYNKKYAVSRTPFTILYNLKETNQVDCLCVNHETGELISKNKCDICLWRDWEKTSRGKRQLGYSGKKEIKALLSCLDEDIDKAEQNLIIFNDTYQLSVSNLEYKIMIKNELVIPFLDILQISKLDAELFLINNHIYYFEIIDLLPVKQLTTI